MEKLQKLADSIENTDIKLSLYGLIIEYTRNHGIMPTFAKALYKKYMIERNDFTKLDESYQFGKKVLDYTNFLDSNDQIKLNYALSVHAYSLMDYCSAIELGMYVAEHGKGEYQAHAIYNVCSAYYHRKQYDMCQLYLKKYSQFTYPFVPNNVKLMIAFINGKTGNIDLAISELNSYLQQPCAYTLTSAVTELLDLYLYKKDLDVGWLFQYEDLMTETTEKDYATPYIKSKFAYYFRLKGKLLKHKNQVSLAIDSYLKSSSEYIKIGHYKEASISLLLVLQTMFNDNKINHEIVQKANSLMNFLNSK